MANDIITPGGGSCAEECSDCNVLHIDFGGGVRMPAPDRQAPLTDREIAGLRRIFQGCPIARKALDGTLR